MAVIPQDRRGQLLLVFTILAAAVLYFTYSGPPIGCAYSGISAMKHKSDSLQKVIDTLNLHAAAAQAIVSEGGVTRLERQLNEYRANLDMMRQLVPAGEEIPNLLDDISSRAKVRGATVTNFVPRDVESGFPFDTKRVRFTVTGRYDQIGDFLADIASLPRVIVVYDLHLERAPNPTNDTTRNRGGALLQASFQVKTFVKPSDAELIARAPRDPRAARKAKADSMAAAAKKAAAADSVANAGKCT